MIGIIAAFGAIMSFAAINGNAQEMADADCLDLARLQPVSSEYRVQIAGSDEAWTSLKSIERSESKLTISTSLIMPDGSEFNRQTFNISRDDLAMLHGVLLAGEHTIYDLTRTGDRVTGRMMVPGGAMIEIDTAASPALLPGMPLVLTEAVDWGKCETVVWVALSPPNSPYSVTVRRVGTEAYNLPGETVDVVIVEVMEKSGTTRQWITAAAPYVVVKEEGVWGRSEITRMGSSL